MQAFSTSSAFALILCAAAGAQTPQQQVAALYDFESDNLVASTSSVVTASEITATNTTVFGQNGATGDRWLCLTTDWNNSGGSLFFTVTPNPMQTVDFTSISWSAVTNAPNASDSIASVEVYADGILVGSVSQTVHNTVHSFDLTTVESLAMRMAPVLFELRMTGNPMGQSSYEIDGVKVESALCIENLAGDDRVVFLPTPNASNLWKALDGASFIELVDGTARLKAAIVNLDDSELRISICATLTGLVDGANPPSGSPRTTNAVDNASIDTSLWRYYTAFTGTMTGRCKLQGFEATIDRRGEALQVGEGANLKDLTFGVASWFNLNVSSQAPNCPITTDRGDFNFTLGNSCICFGGEVASWNNYGVGTPGCDGVPSLTLPKDPLTDTAIQFTIGNDSNMPVACALLLSGAPDDIPFAPLGGTFLVEFPIMVDTALTVQPGGSFSPCFVPDNPCIVGDCLYLQAICLDVCAPAGLAFSRGLKITIGDL